MTIQQGENIIKEVPIYFHPTSEPEFHVKDQYMTHQTAYVSNLDDNDILEEDEDCASYEYYMALQVIILVSGILFFPILCLGAFFITSKHKNVSKLAYINFLLGSIVVCIICFVLIVYQTFGI